MTTDTQTIDPATAPATAPASSVTADDAPPVSDPPAAAPASQPGTLPAADAIAQAMLSEAEKAAAIEREELCANGVDLATVGSPRPQSLPGFEAPPFDLVGALRTIGSKNRAVADAKAQWESAKEEASTLKKAYDREVDRLSAIIRDMEERQRDSVARQPRLVPTGDSSQSCQWEQREGKPCHVCIVLKAAGAPLPSAEDTDHFDAVQRVLDDESDLFDLANWIEDETGQWLTKAQVETWTPEQRREVALYCAALGGLSEGANRPTRPAVLGTPHDAGDVIDGKQYCRRCQALLRNPFDVAEGEAYYDQGTLVGTDCEPQPPVSAGAPTIETTDEPEVDEVTRAHKVCLCQDPAPKDGRCTTCDGTITGPPAKKRKAR